MRLWSLHPAQLDRVGLVACWREALLAQAVLLQRTKGYKRHPQLERFREHATPIVAIGRYLDALANEATLRGYRFNRLLIASPLEPKDEMEEIDIDMTVTQDQLDYEWNWLLRKVAVRNPSWHEQLAVQKPRPHPLFTVVEGPVASWERVPVEVKSRK